jgi:membrane protease YdiL (CAAX protease family)
MRDLLIARFRPFSQLMLLAGIVLITGGLLSYIGIEAVRLLYGFDFGAEMLHPTGNVESNFMMQGQRVLLFFQQLGMFLIPALIFAHFMRSQRLGNFLFWGEKTNWKVLVIGLATFALAYPMVNLIAYFNMNINLPEGLAQAEEIMNSVAEKQMEFIAAIVHNVSFGSLLFSAIAIAVIPAIGEEFLFRGCIQRVATKWFKSVHVGIIVTALFFSLFHFEFFGFLPRFFLGMLLGYLYYYSKNIWLPILAHFANNFMAFMVMKYELASNNGDISALKPPAEIGLAEITFALIGAVAFYFVFKYFMKMVSKPELEVLYKWDLEEEVSGEQEIVISE